MKILQLAYPYEPVSPVSAGGTEQIVLLLDRELTRLGHESVVLARQGSQVSGRLVEGAPADADFETSCQRYYGSLESLVTNERFDVLHNQGHELQHRPGSLEAPVLSTIHLARRLYPRSPLVKGPGRYYNLVSRAQRHRSTLATQQAGYR